MSSTFSAIGAIYINTKITELDLTIQSLLSQSRPFDEIILYVDGPIVKELDEYITSLPDSICILWGQENLGLAHALNCCANSASSDWLVRYDTDDINEVDRLEKIELALNKEKAANLVCSDIAEFDKDPKKIISYRRSSSQEAFLKSIWLKCPINHVSVAIRRDYLIDNGGYPLKPAEDYHLWLKLYRKDLRILYIPLPLVRVRVDESLLQRRVGLTYVKTEYSILVYKLRYTDMGMGKAVLGFCLRAFPRMLPGFLFRRLFFLLRSKS